MKDKFKIFLKVNWKPIVGVIGLIGITSVILIFHNLEVKENSVEDLGDISGKVVVQEEESEVNEELEVLETLEVDETKVSVKDGIVVKTEDVTENVTEDKSEDESEKTMDTVNPIENPESESERTITIIPTNETEYIPISEGWKEAKTAKGDISKVQKADLDSMIASWKDGNLTDTELRDEIISYLQAQKIEYLEVSVTSKGYALYDEVPEVNLKNGGNLYSFVGTYSTGKQNPDKTNKTVCYNWSAFVF